jgi:5-(carboxyamino)imidazole ribonucleotide synthase
MAAEAASALGLSVAVLAESPHDAACAAASTVIVGSPRDPEALGALARASDVVTFDHEQVDLDLVAALVDDGVIVRPGLHTLAMAVDKAHMRRTLAGAGLPVPAHFILEGEPAAADGLASFAADHGWPLVLKTARGGYDGKGVWVVDDLPAARGVLDGHDGTWLAEELVPFEAELAVMVARRPSGEMVAWPAVETAQVGGVCREVLVPGRIPASVVDRACTLGQEVAALAGAVGILAVELFWWGQALLVNEIAARPHNSGHWTMEGAVTSQFENHLRAVLDLPLGSADPQHRAVASVNVFSGEGSDPHALLAPGLAVPGAHVHLYGKEARPGRKLGHVTVCGDDPELVRTRAWEAALALGTPRPEGLTLPAGLSTGSGEA